MKEKCGKVILAMNVLSKLLDVAVESGVFSYHPKCKKIKLTHLCFTDDLLIFTKEKIDFIIGIQNVLKLFYSFPGLQINYTKCELFLTRVYGGYFGNSETDWV